MVVQKRLDKKALASLMASVLAENVCNIPLWMANGDKSFWDEKSEEMKIQNLMSRIQTRIWNSGAHDLRFAISPHIAGLEDGCP